jgi:signal transduction histidine kinase
VDRGYTREMHRLDERDYDAAALRIAERVRSSLDIPEVLRSTLDELGHTLGVTRAIIQLAPDGEGSSLMLEWVSGGTTPLDVRPPTPDARQVFATGEPLVIDDVGECPLEDVRAYFDRVGSRSAVTFPVRWRQDVIAALGFQDTSVRAWGDEALPLLRRLDAQLAGAVAQAQLFEQQRQALEQSHNLSRLREELMANVSHELRTPVSAILGLAKTLRRPDLEVADERRHEMLGMIEAQAERLGSVAEELLDLARFRHGSRSLRPSRVAVSRLADLSCQGVDLEGRRLDVRIEDDCELQVDPSRLAQVLSNLLVNAVRHGQGAVLLRGFSSGPHYVFHISDEGRGVEPEYAEEIFLPFSRRSDRSDSTGLGLAIARAIVEAHGGTLVYLPAGEDARHQFVVTLPKDGPPGASWSAAG